MLPPVLLLLLFATSGFREPVTWPAPTLEGPVRVIDVPATGGDWSGNPPGVDCRVRMPTVPVSGLVKVAGCDDISLVGGEFKSNADPCSAVAGGDSESAALYLADFTGTAHVEGVVIRGPGFSDGIYMSSTEPASIGEVVASRFGGFAACAEPATGSIGGWPKEHPDCFQTWAGPATLRFDKVTCSTVYEGLNLDTNNWSDTSGRRYPAKLIDIRRTNVHLDERAPNGRQCLSVWNLFTPVPTRLERVHCAPGNSGFSPLAPTLAANAAWWGGVRFGVPAGGDETAPGEAGIGYRPAVAGEILIRPPGGPGGDGPGGNPNGNEQPGGRKVARGSLLKTLRQGLRLSVRCPRSCLVTARATISRKAGRRLGLRSRRARLPVGFARARLSRPGHARVVVPFSKRHRLRRAHRLKLSVHVTVRSKAHRWNFTRRIQLVRGQT